MKRCKKHFTLLEVVVATSLLTLVGMLIAMSVASFHRSWSQGRKVAQRLERNIAIDRIAETVIRSMVDFRWLNEEEGSDELVFLGEADELWVTAMNRSYGGNSAFRFARLYMEDGVLLCDYSDTPFLPWIDLKDQIYRTETIAKGVSALTFRYATENDSGELEWLEDWDLDEYDKLPLAIQMTIEWEDGSKQRWTRRQAGTSYYTEVLPGL